MFQMQLRPSLHFFFFWVHVSDPYRATLQIHFLEVSFLFTNYGYSNRELLFIMKHNFSLINSCCVFIFSIFFEYTAYRSGYMWKILSQHDGHFLLECSCHRHWRKNHAASHTQSTVVTIYLFPSTLRGVDEPNALIAETVIVLLPPTLLRTFCWTKCIDYLMEQYECYRQWRIIAGGRFCVGGSVCAPNIIHAGM